MVDPCTVVKRIHAAPTVKKNNHWCGGWLWGVGFVDPVFLRSGAVPISDDGFVCLKFSSGSGLRLSWRSRNMKRSHAQNQRQNNQGGNREKLHTGLTKMSF